MNKNYITCKRVIFYSKLDEDMFFEWIKKINCIKSFEGAGDEMYLDFVESELSYDDMKDIISLLYRYKVDMTQLQPFVNQQNKDAVAPWKQQIYS